MNQYCKTKRKTIVHQMDIRGKTNQKQLYTLYAERDNENDLENLDGDSDTKFWVIYDPKFKFLIKRRIRFNHKFCYVISVKGLPLDIIVVGF